MVGSATEISLHLLMSGYAQIEVIRKKNRERDKVFRNRCKSIFESADEGVLPP